MARMSLWLGVGGAAILTYLLTRKSASSPASVGAVLPPYRPLQPEIDPPALTKTLDIGLTVNELAMVKEALAHETSPKHLGGIASTFEPDYPITASLLRAKSAVMGRRSMGSARRAEIAEKHAKRYKKIPSREAALSLVHLGPALREVGKGDVPDWVGEHSNLLKAEVSPWRVWVLTQRKGPLTKADFDEARYHYPRQRVSAEEAHRIRCLVGLFIKDGGLLRKTPAEIAKAYKVTENEARFALASVRELTDDIRVATPLLRQLPPATRPSKEALRLAATVLKPVHTKTITPEETKVGIEKARAIIHGAAEGHEHAKRARQELGRAGKLIERRRWIQWYNRRKSV